MCIDKRGWSADSHAWRNKTDKADARRDGGVSRKKEEHIGRGYGTPVYPYPYSFSRPYYSRPRPRPWLAFPGCCQSNTSRLYSCSVKDSKWAACTCCFCRLTTSANCACL